MTEPQTTTGRHPTLGARRGRARRMVAAVAATLAICLPGTPAAHAGPATTSSSIAAGPSTATGPITARAAVTLTTAGPGSDVDPFGEHTPVVVVMDTSGSMEYQDATGIRRIDGARSAILDLIDALPTQQRYALTSYPGGPVGPDGCASGIVQTPLGPLNPVLASAAVRHLRPDGDTPTGPALNQAARLLAADAGAAHGIIVLVSDGESNCGTPPCDVANQIRAQGYDVVVNTVGFQVEADAQSELQCIADATGGRYTNVSDAAELAAAVAAGAIANLTVTVTAPDRLAVITGGDDTSDRNQFTVAVGSDGRVSAHDVRVSLRLDSADQVGTVAVSRPVTYLGNLATGLTTTVTVQARPRTQVPGPTWRVDVTARNAVPVTVTGQVGVADDLTPAAAGPLLSGITRIAVLGDSYSSGEGAGDYTDTGAAGCHRSQHTYGRVIWGKDALILACSGAVTSSFFSPQQTHAGVIVSPQLRELRKAALSSQPPQAVLLSIGGNDAGFTDVAMACIQRTVCEQLFHDPNGGLTTPVANMQQRALGVADSVTHALASVDAAVNDPAALARRHGKVAPILLMPYPFVTPDSGLGPKGCVFGISERELGYLNSYQRVLNDTVSGAALALAVQGRPFYVVSDAERAFQPDHTACETTNAWVNVPSVTTIRLNPIRQATQVLDKESLHPNQDGYRAEARAIIAYSHTRAASPTRPIRAHRPAPDWATIDAQIDDRTWHDGLDQVNTILPSPGSPVRSGATGFMPGAPVQVRLDSAPTALTMTDATGDGTVDVRTQLPRYIPSGAHHLRVIGMDPAGQLRVASSPIRVWPAGMLPWSALTGLALALLVIGLVTVRRSNRPTPTPDVDGGRSAPVLPPAPSGPPDLEQPHPPASDTGPAGQVSHPNQPN